MVLRPSPRKWLLVLIGCAAFTAIGIWMVRDGESAGWFVGAFFGLGTVIASAALLPGAGGLKLDAEGFEVMNFFRRTRTRWQDASSFEAVAVPPSNTLLVGYDDAKAGLGRIADINRSLTGRNAALPDTYGLAAEQLAGLMTQWRAQALR